ncbi:MAG: DUF819 family protein [Planctomycetota bacterium]|nr:DUF819 family protein [Planctomycetota bacterium]
MFEETLLTNPLLILGVLCVNIAITEWLCRHSFLKHFGTALLVIIVTAIAANLKVIPTESSTPIYSLLSGEVVSLAVFWLLLQVNLRELLKAGAPMISMFLIGSFGTFMGVMIAMFVVKGATHFPDGSHVGLAAMFTGTYTGGSINFNAMAAAYDVSDTGALFTGAIVSDNVLTAIWMVMCIAIPRGLGFLKGRHQPLGANLEPAQALTGVEQDTDSIHPLDLALLIALGAGAVALSDWIADIGKARGMVVPSMLYLTIIALVLAQTPVASKLKGTRTLGMFAVYLFLAVIGAWCDIEALGNLDVGARLFVFVVLVVAIHGLITFVAGALFKVDRDIIAVASQANIGGGTSALAIARSLGRGDLVLPAILVGSLGTALGNFLGWLAATVMMKMQATGG